MNFWSSEKWTQDSSDRSWGLTYYSSAYLLLFLSIYVPSCKLAWLVVMHFFKVFFFFFFFWYVRKMDWKSFSEIFYLCGIALPGYPMTHASGSCITNTVILKLSIIRKYTLYSHTKNVLSLWCCVHMCHAKNIFPCDLTLKGSFHKFTLY